MADRAFQTFVESRFQHNFNQMGQFPLQDGGGPSQVQQPQYYQLQGFVAPQYGGGPSQVQQPQLNQPQNSVAAQLTALPAATPPQFAPQGHAASNFDGNAAPIRTQSPPVKQECKDEDNGTNQSPPVKVESEDENNGASRSIWTRSEGSTGRNGSPSRNRSTGVQR
ncbi:hypothetical protein NU219Hw_g4392t1 [Hortaea werneckii]